MQKTSNVADAFDVLASRHNSGVNSEDLFKVSLYHAATWSAILQAIASIENCSILDVGGGNGLWTIRLAELGHRITYVDVARQMAKIASINAQTSGVHVQIVLGDAHSLDFLPPERFDLVLAVGDLLCYTATPVEILCQAFRLCKPGGKLVAAVMGRYGMLQHLLATESIQQVKQYLSSGWWTEFSEAELGGTELEEPLAAHTYTVKELTNLCRSAEWRPKIFFSAGILRTLIGRKWLASLIKREGIDSILDLEQRLAESVPLLDCSMEFGLIAEKAKTDK